MSDIWQGRNKPTTADSFLKKEDTFYILLETGDKVVLSYGVDWAIRNKPTAG